MPYPEEMCAPMRAELTQIGVQELRDANEVSQFMDNATGSAMIVFNSVCGCAAGNARPAVAAAIKSELKPDRVATVFAGQDVEAVAKVRSYFPDVPPSSPSIILMKDGQISHYVPRHLIEGRDPQTIANALVGAFEEMAGAGEAVAEK